MSKKGLVYFIVTYGQDAPARCKIGFTAGNPEARMRDLQCGSPVKLMFYCAFEGTMETEQELHRIFAQHCVHGEWFDAKDDLLDFLASFVREVDSGNIFSQERMRERLRDRVFSKRGLVAVE